MRRAAIAACAVAAIADAAPVPASPHQLLAAEDAAAAAAAAAGRPHGKKRERTTVLLEATFQERSRDALLFVPEGLAPGSLVPVIFNYHGFTGSSESQQRNTMMDPVCERRGCAVVYPNGWGIAGSGVLRSHNGGSCCSPANLLDDPSDDVGLANVWLEEASIVLSARELVVDRRRVYSVGMSNGGFMSIRLGCESTATFAAVASVTGVLGNEDPETDQFDCNLGSSEGRPIPYLHVHGTADGTVPFDGNGGGFKSVEETVATFRDLNQCGGAGPGEVTYQNSTVTCTSYCPDDSINVTKCRVEGGGHVWFAPESCSGVGCGDIDSTEVVVDFFLRHSRSALQNAVTV